MERSHVNNYIVKAMSFYYEKGIILPEFAFWTLQDWFDIYNDDERLMSVDYMLKRGVGWDVTDFGLGKNYITTLFTYFNGSPLSPNGLSLKYIFRNNTGSPPHIHIKKTETVVNMGPGVLEVMLWNSSGVGNSVTVSINSQIKNYHAGEVIVIPPGGIIEVTPSHKHSYKARGPVLVGENSSYNDDIIDNIFDPGVVRFPPITEDLAECGYPINRIYPLWNDVSSREKIKQLETLYRRAMSTSLC